MTFFDIVVACILGFAVFKGFKNGLIISVLSLVSLILGIYLSLRFSFFIKNILADQEETGNYSLGIISFLITFLFVLVGLFFLGKLLTKVLDVIALGFLNRLGGAVFEIIKFTLIISVLLNVFQKINFNEMIISREKLENSFFYLPIESVSKKIFPLMERGYEIAKEKKIIDKES